MNILGNQTRSVFLKEAQSHKLHQEFTVATGNSVKHGQPVKLNASGDIVPAGASEAQQNIIGFSVHTAQAGEEATIAMKGYGIVYARANADSQVAGPVAYKGMSAVSGEEAFAKYGAAAGTGADLAGWAIDAGDEDDTIRVVIAS